MTRVGTKFVIFHLFFYVSITLQERCNDLFCSTVLWVLAGFVRGDIGRFVIFHNGSFECRSCGQNRTSTFPFLSASSSYQIGSFQPIFVVILAKIGPSNPYVLCVFQFGVLECA